MTENENLRAENEALKQRVERLHQAYGSMHTALELIAAPRRPDGTYNRNRAACEVLARETLNQVDNGEYPFVEYSFSGYRLVPATPTPEWIANFRENSENGGSSYAAIIESVINTAPFLARSTKE